MWKQTKPRLQQRAYQIYNHLNPEPLPMPSPGSFYDSWKHGDIVTWQEKNTPLALLAGGGGPLGFPIDKFGPVESSLPSGGCEPFSYNLRGPHSRKDWIKHYAWAKKDQKICAPQKRFSDVHQGVFFANETNKRQRFHLIFQPRQTWMWKFFAKMLWWHVFPVLSRTVWPKNTMVVG